MTGRLRTSAVLALLLFTIDLVALPCGPACHQADAETAESAAEHACHEAPVTEGLPQVAALPGACAHQHDAADPPRISASSERNQHGLSTPVILPLPSYAGIVRLEANPSPPPRPSSLNTAGVSFSLRI